MKENLSPNELLAKNQDIVDAWREFVFLAGIFTGMGLLAIILDATKLSPNEMEKKAQKDAISHGAAHYAVDTNGVVSFEWNK